MPTAAIPLEALKRPELPAICVVTGATAGVEYRAVTLMYDASAQTGRGNLVEKHATALVAPQPPTRVTALLPFTQTGYEKFIAGRGLLVPTVLAGFGSAAAVGWALSYLHPIAATVGAFAALFVVPMAIAARQFERWGLALRGVAFGRAVIEMPSAAAAAEIEKKFGPMPSGAPPAPGGALRS